MNEEDYIKLNDLLTKYRVVLFKEFLKENSLSDYKPSFDYSLGLDKIELKHKRIKKM